MKKNTTDNFTIERFSPNTTLGLTSIQVQQRKDKNLINTVKKKFSKSYLNILTNNVFTFFNLLGLIVAVALAIVGASITDFFFVGIYLANMAIGIIQEVRAKKCIDKLSLVSSKSTKVIRDGQEIEISSKDIVLDDILKLGIGNQIPTDCIILDGDVEVNESLLTGESVPIKKKVGDVLLAGSFITCGVCLALADKVGSENYVEKLSEKAKAYKKPQSELMNSLKLIIKVISCLIVPLAAALMIKACLIQNVDTASAIMTTATSIIGMIPSGMFLLTSMALAVGIVKLAKHNTLVQDLYSLEMLARVDTICFDKTGTITNGDMTVSDIITLDENIKNANEIISSMLYALKDDNQTAKALKSYFGEQEIYESTAILPFNSSRKFSAVTFSDKTYAFGAPEFLLNKIEYGKIREKIEKYASDGLRVLVFASSNSKIIEDSIEKDFTPLAIILLLDTIREDAIQTIKWFKDNGVTIKVISGDNPITVAEVSKRVGIDNADKYISLEGLTDQEVIDVANEYTVFGRVSPEQKALLVKSMKNAGHTTAMTGDGVNDILALKEANCAISVAQGSDAARNVSHIVLMDNNFNSMPKVVHEGRRVINNVQSSASLFLMKTIFTMVMTFFTLVFLQNYPFKLSNMLLLEVLVIGFPSFFLSLQPNNARVEGKFIKTVLAKSIPGAIMMISSAVVVDCFGNISTSEAYKTVAVFAITYSGLANLLNICTPLNRYRSVLFLTNFALATISAVVILFLPQVSAVMGLQAILSFSLYSKELILLICVILGNLPISFLLSMLFNKLIKHKRVK